MGMFRSRSRRFGSKGFVLHFGLCFLAFNVVRGAPVECTEGSFQCKDGACIPAAHHCDGYDHCGDEFDEDPELCRGQQPHFTCKSGNSIAASAHCNGYDNCSDGSDEDPAECEVNTLLVAAGEVVTARVQHNVSRGWIYFTLCDDSSCSSIDVYGTTPHGLKYKTWTTCSRLGAYGCHWSNWHRPPGATPLPTGEHVFLVERRSSELALWPQGRPELVVTVRIKEGYDRLRIRYFRWMKDMPPVQYTGGKLWQPATTADFEADLKGCGGARFFGPLVSGTLARPEYFPWHGALYQKVHGEYKYLCGASLLSASALITAAHCVQSREGNYYVAIGMLTSDWNKDSVGVHKSKVSQVIIHPDYYGLRGKYDADLAILHLEKPAPLGRRIGTLCVSRAEGTSLAAEDIITVAGWGNGSAVLDELHFAELPFLPRRQCLTAISEAAAFAVSYLTNDKFCSVRDRGVILKGDSGGGAVARHLGVWYLVGVVSSGIDSSRIVAFTNTTFGEYASWIDSAVRSAPQPPRPEATEVTTKGASMSSPSTPRPNLTKGSNVSLATTPRPNLTMSSTATPRPNLPKGSDVSLTTTPRPIRAPPSSLAVP
ncbi:enteropeptidase-like isoform X2 [Thrips palmi]|uniref:Enteropeptidase-like isoform X2 n=1 Tax=Thrips palmi TaxID=161013 RepID=A0A6P8YNY1_THRPL|nr:enteropeptidase-like isoform X2 [Thrips palmi]